MNDILLYILVFGFIIIFYLIYSYRKERIKTFNLSETYFSYGTLIIKIKKKGSGTTHIIVKPYFKNGNKNSDIENLNIEILNNDQSNNIDLLSIKESIVNKNGEFIIDFNAFKRFLNENGTTKKNFRFVFYNKDKSKILKSRYLSTGKYLDLYLTDIGKYN